MQRCLGDPHAVGQHRLLATALGRQTDSLSLWLRAIKGARKRAGGPLVQSTVEGTLLPAGRSTLFYPFMSEKTT